MCQPTKPTGKITSFRAQPLSSLVLLPIAIALGHTAPAIGAGWVAVGGTRIWDVPLLVLIFSLHALLDSYDKYRDMPPSSRGSNRPSWYLLWTGGLGAMIIWSSYECGYETSTRLVGSLGLAVLWAAPLIPAYGIEEKRWKLIKLKQVLGPFKSAFAGVVAGFMDASPASLHVCIAYPSLCSSSGSKSATAKSLGYSILYNFIRETIYDVRDEDEDKAAGIMTLCTSLGKPRTLLVLIFTALLGEAWIIGEYDVSKALSILMAPSALEHRRAHAGRLRGVLTVGASTILAVTSRENNWIWAVFSMLALAPAWHAMAALK